MEQGRNRVFINPNFNKGANSTTQRQVTVMHVNPNFCHHHQIQSVQPFSKGKIYINPKFMGSNRNSSNQTPLVNPCYESNRLDVLVDGSNIFRSEVSSTSTQKSVNCSTIPTKPSYAQPMQSNSRYSLVRNNRPELPQMVETNTKITNSQTNTVKVNKYKSIRITDMKKNIDSVKPLIKFIPSKMYVHSSAMQTTNTARTSQTKSPKVHSNRYKLVRPTYGLVNKTQMQRLVTFTARKVMTNRTRIKTVGVYKKNNIPCPQYRKYGKCLRKLQGKCEFLHDSKHVSICKKFLIGVCHDEKCLLSHELSDKKMPTCYFYLKGMCTKEGCPYLHVKLNEKAKICSDFIKGYCEKGDQCLDRHIANTSIALKRSNHTCKQTPRKSSKYTNDEMRLKNGTESVQKRKRKIKLRKQSSFEDNRDSCGRYYKDKKLEQEGSESLETIKPSRCKLGVLPSFIQL